MARIGTWFAMAGRVAVRRPSLAGHGCPAHGLSGLPVRDRDDVAVGDGGDRDGTFEQAEGQQAALLRMPSAEPRR
jgi:hypothetical protein